MTAKETSLKESAIVAYIPALHKGYLDFFKEYPGGSLYILGADLIREVPLLERDIRALDPGEIEILVGALGIFKKVAVLGKNNLQELLGEAAQIVLPDEDASRQFAAQYLSGKEFEKKFSFVPVFLRWDKHNATKAFQVSPDRVVSSEKFDREMIARTQKEAAKSPDWWRKIGGLVVKEGAIMLTAHNHPLPSDYVLDAFGDPRSNFDYGQYEHYKTIHAEAGMIAEAARKGISLEGTKLYATTFPCPACAKLIAVSGIKEVYYATGYSALDAEDILRKFGIKIVMVD